MTTFSEMYCRSACLCVVGLIMPMVMLAAADWNHFRGNPANDGRSEEADLLSTWPEGGPALLWSRFDLPLSHATPVVVDGVIYLASKGRGEASLIAIALADGKEIWRSNVESGNASPAVVDGRIFIQGRGHLTAVDASTGEQIWSEQPIALLPKTDWENRTAYDNFAGSPVAALGKVFWVTGHDQSPVIALDQATGELAWASQGSTAASSRGWGSPALVQHHGRPLLLAHTGWHLLVLDPETGQVLAEKETMGGQGSKGRNKGYSIGNVPAYCNGLLFSSAHFAGPVWTTWRLTDSFGLEKVWHNPCIRPYQGSTICHEGLLFGRGELAWQDADANPDLLVNGKAFKAVFFKRRKSKDDGKRSPVKQSGKADALPDWDRAQLVCQNVVTGMVIGARADIASRKAFCDPVMSLADGRIYMRWSWGHPEVYLLEPTPAMTVHGKLTLAVPADAPEPKKDWYGFSAPVISDGRLVMRYMFGLYVYDICAEAGSGE